TSYLIPAGYHEVLALGYDQTGLWIQNSWGSAWGWNGLARITWSVVDQDVYTAYTTYGFAPSSGPNPSKDTTPPTMSAVSQQFTQDATITDTTAPVTFHWSAADASGITAYAVYVKTDAGKYTYQQSASAGTSYNFALSFGHTYQVAVAA